MLANAIHYGWQRFDRREFLESSLKMGGVRLHAASGLAVKG